MENLNVNEIEVNGIKYVRKQEFTGDIRIVILQRGWVYIGKFERDGDLCKLHHSSVIRHWGTKKGLGELVNGPTKETKLDACSGVVEFDWLTVIHTISVNEKSWNAALSI